MGMINWIFDIYQHHKIDQAKEEAIRAREAAACVSSGGSQLDVQRPEQALGEPCSA